MKKIILISLLGLSILNANTISFLECKEHIKDMEKYSIEIKRATKLWQQGKIDLSNEYIHSQISLTTKTIQKINILYDCYIYADKFKTTQIEYIKMNINAKKQMESYLNDLYEILKI